VSTSTVNDKLLPPQVRTIIYLIVVLACVTCLILGVITEDQANNILLLIGTVLGIAGGGLALINRPVENSPKEPGSNS
jgi:nitrate/nitrite transporter NarK